MEVVERVSLSLVSILSYFKIISDTNDKWHQHCFPLLENEWMKNGILDKDKREKKTKLFTIDLLQASNGFTHPCISQTSHW